MCDDAAQQGDDEERRFLSSAVRPQVVQHPTCDDHLESVRADAVTLDVAYELQGLTVLPTE